MLLLHTKCIPSFNNILSSLFIVLLLQNKLENQISNLIICYVTEIDRIQNNSIYLTEYWIVITHVSISYYIIVAINAVITFLKCE